MAIRIVPFGQYRTESLLVHHENQLEIIRPKLIYAEELFTPGLPGNCLD